MINFKKALIYLERYRASIKQEENDQSHRNIIENPQNPKEVIPYAVRRDFESLPGREGIGIESLKKDNI